MASTSSAGDSTTSLITKCDPHQLQTCCQCQTKRKVQYKVTKNNNISYICYSSCLDNFKRENVYESWPRAVNVRNFSAAEAPARTCSVCGSTLDNVYGITWEAMDFCNELCLLERQIELCSICVHCSSEIPPEFLGKHCVAFGIDIRQFCSSACLSAEENHELCSFCLKILTTETFCGPNCKRSFDLLEKAQTDPRPCKKCSVMTVPAVKYTSTYFDPESYFCSSKCFQEFCAAHGVEAKTCGYCNSRFNSNLEKSYSVFNAFTLYHFCSEDCRKLYTFATKVPMECGNCGIKKTNFDMVRKHTEKRATSFCSLKCLGLHQFIEQWLIAKCDQCAVSKALMFTFPMADSSMCQFCSFPCLYKFRFNTTNNENVTSYLKGYMKNVSTISRTQDKATVKLPPPSWTVTKGKTVQTYSRKKPQKKGRPKKRSKSVQQPANVEPTGQEIECIFIQNGSAEMSSDPQGNESAFIELSDRNGLLECTFGINTFTFWLTCHRKTPVNILQMNPNQISNFLAEFVQTIKRPDGEKFAPDTIYYLCLGIQKYLLQNGSNINIFTDTAFENFRNGLDSVALTFQIPHNQLATTIEEDHLWDTKQLGDCSPHVLINTLIYIFTKNCYLTSVRDHLGLSLKQINQEFMIGFRKRTPDNMMVTCFRRNDLNVLWKHTFILHKNNDNPSRCPVRLCQFYADKCPSDVKMFEQVFYFQPIENCTVESGLWFKNVILPPATIQRALNLFRMVKEINDVIVNV